MYIAHGSLLLSIALTCCLLLLPEPLSFSTLLRQVVEVDTSVLIGVSVVDKSLKFSDSAHISSLSKVCL